MAWLTGKSCKTMDNESTQQLNIGQMIEAEVRRQGISVSEFARRIHTDRRNVYNIFQRATIDTGLLSKICFVLRRDFFADYSASVKLIL